MISRKMTRFQAATTVAFVVAVLAFMLAYVTIAEPGAMIAFAGQRVIANAMSTELPEGFQTAEFLLASGFVDRIVHRNDLRSELANLIDYCAR